MQPIAHIIDYYSNQLERAHAKDWPHTRLREHIREYKILHDNSQCNTIYRSKENTIDAFRGAVLHALDITAADLFNNRSGWTDKDLGPLFKTIDEHVEQLAIRYRVTLLP